MAETRFALVPQAMYANMTVSGVSRSGAPCEFFDSNRKRYWVPAAYPRFDYNPDSGAYLGMKTEAASVNLLWSSSDMSLAAWTKTNIFGPISPVGTPVTGPAGSCGPDGLAMCTMVGTGTNAAHCSEQSRTTTANVDYVYSIELKYKTGNLQQYVQVYLDDGAGNGAYVNVDLTTGAIQNGGAAVSMGTGVSNITAAVIYYRSTGNFWTAGTNALRVWIRIRHATATTLRAGVAFLNTATGTFKEAHASSSGRSFFVGNNQLEQASAPTSNILNFGTAASASRGAETFIGDFSINVPELVTNHLAYSDQIDNAAWTKVASTVSANAAAGPYLSTLADALLASASAGTQHAVSQVAMAPQGVYAGAINTFFYQGCFKAGATYTAVEIQFYDGVANGFNVSLDLTNGSYSLGASFGGGATVAQCSSIQVTSLGSGWYKINIMGWSTAANTARVLLNVYDTFTNAQAQTNWTPAGGTGIYVFGSQLAYDVFDFQYYIETDGKGPLAAYSSTTSNAGISISTPVDPWPWNGATSYTTGDYVMRPGTFTVSADGSTSTRTPPMIYQRKTVGVTATAPELDTVNWMSVYPTNRWRWFDSSGESQTRWYGSIILIDNSNQADCDVVLLDKTTTGVLWAQVRYPTGAYSSAKSGISSLAGGWLKSFVFNDVTHTAGNWMEISLQLAGFGGVGTIIAGRGKRIGYSQYGAQVGIKDYSKKTTDSFGNTTIVKGAYAKRMSVPVRIANSDMDAIVQLLADNRASFVAWVAVADTYASMSMFGFYNSFDVVVSYPSESLCNFVIEGVA